MIPLHSDMLSAHEGLAHGFFGRRGGVSSGLYASLNCGFGSGDNPTHVAENRARVMRFLGGDPDRLANVYQVHSADAVQAERAWPRGEAPHADAMATRTRGLALGILTADCAPVLLADAEAGVIGAAHAGWKGAFGGVLDSVVGLMEELGAARARIVAVIGPTISQAAYEVGPEFRARFLEQGAANDAYFMPGARDGYSQFNLPAYVHDRLACLGVGKVQATGVCTYGDADAYFSFRRTTHRGEPDYGRNLSVIMLRP